MAEGPETQLPNSSSDKPSSQDSFNDQTQAPPSNGSEVPNGNIPFPPFMYPGIFPQQDQEPMNHGPGLYAVPVHPFTQQPIAYNNLVPFTYNLHTQRNNSMVIREVGGEHGQPVGPPEQQQQQQQQVRIVREVVWRFEINLPLDIWLIIKLVAAVLLLSRDGSRQRLIFLSFLAVLAYLYRVGTLAPVVRRLSRRMRRAVGPPHPPRVALRANNLPADVAQGDVNAGGENENRAAENEHDGEAEQVEAGNRLWRIVKEIQIIVVGFVASLIPGFYND